MPRPKLYDTKIEVNLTNYDFEFLRKKAQRENTTVSDLLRLLIKEAQHDK